MGKDGKVYSTGTFEGTPTNSFLNFNSQLDLIGDKNVYIVCIDSNTGSFISDTSSSASNARDIVNHKVFDIDVDENGNVYICGNFTKTIIFSPLTLTAVGNEDGYVLGVTYPMH